MDHGACCDHDFLNSETVPFAGTDGARSCRRCEHVEVLVDGAWIDFDDYLEQRRSNRAAE